MTFSWCSLLGLLVRTLLSLMPLTSCCLLLLHRTEKYQWLDAKNIYNFLSSTAMPIDSTENCWKAPYFGTVCWYGWSCACRGVPWLKSKRALSTYPVIDTWTGRFLVIPVKGESGIFFCLPNLLKFHSALLVHSRGVVPILSDILDSKIVYHKCEASWSPLVLPKPRCKFGLFIAMLLKYLF